MKILVACEFSATVRDAFRRKGHDAYSCDFEPCEGDPRYHWQGDVLPHLRDGWDLLIGHPPCPFMTNTANAFLYNADKSLNYDRWPKMHAAVTFFKQLWDAPVERVCLENPIMNPYARAMIGMKQTQVLQPYMFGHLETKATCLWLRGIPPLQPTTFLRKQTMALPERIRCRINYLSHTKDRWKLRSKTFQGIANAMAEQWG